MRFLLTVLAVASFVAPSIGTTWDVLIGDTEIVPRPPPNTTFSPDHPWHPNHIDFNVPFKQHFPHTHNESMHDAMNNGTTNKPAPSNNTTFPTVHPHVSNQTVSKSTTVEPGTDNGTTKPATKNGTVVNKNMGRPADAG